MTVEALTCCFAPLLPAWCNECLPTPRTFHVRIGGPGSSGKTSIVRLITDSSEPLAHTEELEISVANVEGVSLILYDSGDAEEEDFSSAKFINISPTSVRPRRPEGVVFVIDGHDRGRLPLAAKLMQTFMDTYYRSQVLLILITKSDLVTVKSPIREEEEEQPMTVSPRRMEQAFSPTGQITPRSSDDLIFNSAETMGRFQLSSPQQRKRSSNIIMEVTSIMSHPSLMQKDWHIFTCSAVTGEGVAEAFRWMVSALSSK